MTTPENMNWQIIRNDNLSFRQKQMLKTADKLELQRSFLERACADDSSEFCKYFLEIGIEGSKLCDSVPMFSECEFLEPPWESELAIWNLLNDLPPTTASLPGFWTRFCVQSVEQEQIHASTFAQVARSSKDINGKARIYNALNNNDEKEIDSCVRRIFRVMGGALCERGNRTSYIDCPLARCWWRHRVARETTKLLNNPEQIKEISDLLRPTYIWETVLEHIVSKQTIVGFPKILAAIVDELFRMTQCEQTNKKSVKETLAAVGGQCSRQAIDLLEMDSVLQTLFDRKKWIGMEARS